MAKIKCENCGAKFSGNFCPICSTPAPEQPKKKKKKWVLPLVVAVVLILVVSCFAGGGEEEVKQPSDVQSGSTASQTASTKQSAGKNETIRETEPAASVSISEQEIYNKDGVIVTAKKLQDGLFGPEISVVIENNSEKNIVVSTQSLSVNNFMLSSSGMYCDIAAGKKANDEIDLMSSELRESGISTIAEIAFYLHIYNSDTYNTIDDSELITIQTSAFGTFTQETDDSGDEVFSANDLRVICKGLKKDSIWDGTVVFYLENNSGKAVSIYAENVSVNGFMVDVGMYSSLRPATRMVDGMYLLNTELDSIDDIRDIEFTLRIFDSDTFRDISKSDVIRLEFNP
ncbi:MAG: hypothetical protein ACI4V1_05210 [Eubacteriales bacterium]